MEEIIDPSSDRPFGYCLCRGRELESPRLFCTCLRLIASKESCASANKRLCFHLYVSEDKKRKIQIVRNDVAWVGLRVWWSVCDGTMGVRVRLCGTNGVAKGWRENWQVCKVRVRVC